jgi:hypothetical protein
MMDTCQYQHYCVLQLMIKLLPKQSVTANSTTSVASNYSMCEKLVLLWSGMCQSVMYFKYTVRRCIRATYTMHTQRALTLTKRCFTHLYENSST